MNIKEIVQEITSIIPGFSGYYQMEKRREEDKILRDFLFKQIEEIEEKIQDKIKSITKSGELKSLDIYGSISKEIERIKDSVRYTSYGYKGFFDIIEVNEDTLEEILNIDIEMIRKVKEFEVSMIDEPKLLYDFIKKFEELFNERKKIISGCK